MRRLKVIQWATGGVGRAAIEGVLDHPDLELVGCWVHSEAKVGLDVGELVGRDPVGITTTGDKSDILALDADCVVYSPIMANDAEVIELLESGKNVVTPLGWFYPRHLSHVDAIEAACAKGQTTLHGTGIHPGGITERFPLMVSALSQNITHVRAEEFSDIRTYDAPFVVGEMMLFGKPAAEAEKSPMLSILGAGFKQSIHMIADALGMDIDGDITARHEMALATAPIDGTPVGTIEPGHVAAQRFVWEATVDGQPVVSAIVNWLMGEQHLDRGWELGAQGERFEVEVTGDPPVRLTFHGLHPESIESGLERNRGIVATATHCVSAVPYVCAAEPGIKTYLDLPPYWGRAARELREDR